MIWKLMAAAAALGVAACTAPAPAVHGPDAHAPSDGMCNAGAAQFAVGQKITSLLADEARRAAGAKLARVLKPGQMATMEFNPSRLNLDVNRNDTVTAARCG